MANPTTNIWQVIPFPEPGFACEEPTQTIVLLQEKQRTRFLKFAFITTAIFLALAVLLGLLHLMLASIFCTAIFAMAFCLTVISFFFPTTRGTCERCQKKLETVWATSPDGISAKYRVCRHCHRFTYTFRTRRL